MSGAFAEVERMLPYRQKTPKAERLYDKVALSICIIDDKWDSHEIKAVFWKGVPMKRDKNKRQILIVKNNF